MPAAAFVATCECALLSWAYGLLVMFAVRTQFHGGRDLGGVHKLHRRQKGRTDYIFIEMLADENKYLLVK